MNMLNRQEFLKAAAVTLGGLLAGCVPKPPEPTPAPSKLKPTPEAQKTAEATKPPLVTVATLFASQEELKTTELPWLKEGGRLELSRPMAKEPVTIPDYVSSTMLVKLQASFAREGLLWEVEPDMPFLPIKVNAAGGTTTLFLGEKTFSLNKNQSVNKNFVADFWEKRLRVKRVELVASDKEGLEKGIAITFQDEEQLNNFAARLPAVAIKIVPGENKLVIWQENKTAVSLREVTLGSMSQALRQLEQYKGIFPYLEFISSANQEIINLLGIKEGPSFKGILVPNMDIATSFTTGEQSLYQDFLLLPAEVFNQFYVTVGEKRIVIGRNTFDKEKPDYLISNALINHQGLVFRYDFDDLATAGLNITDRLRIHQAMLKIYQDTGLSFFIPQKAASVDEYKQGMKIELLKEHTGQETASQQTADIDQYTERLTEMTLAGIGHLGSYSAEQIEKLTAQVREKIKAMVTQYSEQVGGFSGGHMTLLTHIDPYPVTEATLSYLLIPPDIEARIDKEIKQGNHSPLVEVQLLLFKKLFERMMSHYLPLKLTDSLDQSLALKYRPPAINYDDKMWSPLGSGRDYNWDQAMEAFLDKDKNP